MSAIDWNIHPEPWRSMGLRFLDDLAVQLGRAIKPPPKRRLRRYLTGSEAMVERLVIAREVENKRWKAISKEFGTTPEACQHRYTQWRKEHGGER